jgi:hypothetical protein
MPARAAKWERGARNVPLPQSPIHDKQLEAAATFRLSGDAIFSAFFS